MPSNEFPFLWRIKLAKIRTRIPDESEISRDIAAVFKHKSYDPRTIKHDVALLKLKQEVDYVIVKKGILFSFPRFNLCQFQHSNQHINIVCLHDGPSQKAIKPNNMPDDFIYKLGLKDPLDGEICVATGYGHTKYSKTK